MTTQALQLVNGVARMQTILPTIYDREETGLTITSGVAHSLPISQTYNSTELHIIINGIVMNVIDDYNYVGSPPRTQVTFTFNIVSTDFLRYIIWRNQ